MPKIQSSVPKNLRPYIFHGVDLQWRGGDKNATADCPFCERGGKFSVKLETGQCKCWGCSVETMESGGNAHVFIRQLAEISHNATSDYSELAEERGIRKFETLIEWGAVKSISTYDWLLPGYSAEGKLNQLYKLIWAKNKRLLLPTPELNHQLFGVNLYDAKKDTVFLCEGPWDGIALWEMLGTVKETEDGLVRTSNREKSLLAEASVLAVPGCNTFFKPWFSLFAGKDVCLMYDSDHPQQGGVVPPAGTRYMKRTAEMLSGCSTPPSSISYLHWGDEGYDPNLPHGTDVRGILGADNPIDELAELLRKLKPVPEEWLSASSVSGGDSTLECVKCEDYRTMITAWRKALKWTDGLDRALSVMLASITSTKVIGDQLWVKVIGPVSSGKSTLCEAISVARRYVYPKDTFTGLTSGYQMDKEGSENLSLVEKLKDMTLLINDGDTLLQLPNLNQVVSQLRAFYGRNLRTQFKNKMSKNHEGINSTIIICGTSSLKALDTSELGERFLDCVIMEGIDDELEDGILWRVANRADKNTLIESDGKPESQNEPEMIEAMCLTGGYVNYLRENAIDLLSSVENPEWAMKFCVRLGKFVAFMRARPSERQVENSEREFAARLVSQHVRLAKCLAVVLNRKAVDEEVMRRVTKVAMDTSRGQVLEMVEDIYKSEEGCTVRGLSQRTNYPESKTRTLIRFLRQIRVVRIVEVINGNSRRNLWRLTPSMRQLYDDVMGSEYA